MGRLAWSQARFRPARTLALIAGVLVAAAAFTVLTAASRTAQVRTTGTVSANFRPAYDILVRPKGARTAQENRTGTVQPDFLSGIYGGITMAQYHQIQQIPGVQVAAPIAMVGYAQLNAADVRAGARRRAGRSGPRLYRISTTWVSDNGASRVTQPPGYLYVTPLRLTGAVPGRPRPRAAFRDAGRPASRHRERTRSARPRSPTRLCWSRVNQSDMPPGRARPAPPRQVTSSVDRPGADRGHRPGRRGGTGRAEQGGRLRQVPDGERERRGPILPVLPVLASSASGMSEYAQTTLQQLAAPAAKPDMNAAWKSAQASAPGRTVATVRTTAQQAYNAVLKGPGTAALGNLHWHSGRRLLVGRPGGLPAHPGRSAGTASGGQPPVGLGHRQSGFGRHGRREQPVPDGDLARHVGRRLAVRPDQDHRCL